MYRNRLKDLLYYSLVLAVIGELFGLAWITIFYMTDKNVASCRYNYGRYAIWTQECLLPKPTTQILFRDFSKP